jgi:hypothetical protein
MSGELWFAENAPTVFVIAISDAKPVPTFAEIALDRSSIALRLAYASRLTSI